MYYIDKKISIGSIINAVIMLLASLTFIIVMKADVQQARTEIDELKRSHRTEIPEIYMRRDVFQVEIQAIRTQLDRIEGKID